MGCIISSTHCVHQIEGEFYIVADVHCTCTMYVHMYMYNAPFTSDSDGIESFICLIGGHSY